VRLTPYAKQALKWLVSSLLLFAVTVVVSHVAWAQMMAGGSYAVAVGFLAILSITATVALCISFYFAVLVMTHRL
jgi:hypothetical protein